MGCLPPKVPPPPKALMLKNIQTVQNAMRESGVAAQRLVESLADIRTYGPTDWEAGRVPQWRDESNPKGRSTEFGMFIPDDWRPQIEQPKRLRGFYINDWRSILGLLVRNLRSLFKNFADGCAAVFSFSSTNHGVPNIPNMPPPPPRPSLRTLPLPPKRTNASPSGSKSIV